MIKTNKTSRPPGRYVVAPGTQYQLTVNEFDKNTYAQCCYISFRTLIRCKQIRSKEDLQKYNGRCEEHEEFRQFLRANNEKEAHRIAAECDNENVRRRRFKSYIVSNDAISDEDEWVQPAASMSQQVPDHVYENFLEEHPLRHAGVFTDKDIMKIKTSIVEEDIKDLKAFKDMTAALGSRLYKTISDEKPKTTVLDFAQFRAYDAGRKYGDTDFMKKAITNIQRLPQGQCCFGPNMSDELVCADIMNGILDRLDNFEPHTSTEQCTNTVVPLTSFCMSHIMLDRKQKMFGMCKSCGEPTFATSHPKCTIHRKSHIKNAIINCKCNSCIPIENTEISEYVEVDSSDSDDLSLGNLSHIETNVQMASPLLSISVPYMNQRRGVSHHRQSNQPQYQRQPQNITPATGVPERVMAESVRSKAEMEENSMTCARVRAVDRTEYPSKNKDEQPAAPKPTPTPRLLSTSVATGRPQQPRWHHQQQQPSQIQQQQQRHLSQPMNARFLPMKQAQQQQQFQQQGRFAVPNQPKSIPLERSQEPTNVDELVEDRKTPPPYQYPVDNDTPRGVPYMGPNNSRGRAASVSTNDQLRNQIQYPMSRNPIPPVPRQPVVRQPSVPQRQPNMMPPHRAIAMGMKPGEMMNAGTPRPTFAPPARRPNMMNLDQGPAQLSTQPIPTGQSPSPSKTYTVVSQSNQRYATLDSARADPNVSKMNVRAFLSLGPQWQNMSQEEIDKKIGKTAKKAPSPKKIVYVTKEEMERRREEQAQRNRQAMRPGDQQATPGAAGPSRSTPGPLTRMRGPTVVHKPPQGPSTETAKPTGITAELNAESPFNRGLPVTPQSSSQNSLVSPTIDIAMTPVKDILKHPHHSKAVNALISSLHQAQYVPPPGGPSTLSSGQRVTRKREAGVVVTGRVRPTPSAPVPVPEVPMETNTKDNVDASGSVQRKRRADDKEVTLSAKKKLMEKETPEAGTKKGAAKKIVASDTSSAPSTSTASAPLAAQDLASRQTADETDPLNILASVSLGMENEKDTKTNIEQTPSTSTLPTSAVKTPSRATRQTSTARRSTKPVKSQPNEKATNVKGDEEHEKEL